MWHVLQPLDQPARPILMFLKVSAEEGLNIFINALRVALKKKGHEGSKIKSNQTFHPLGSMDMLSTFPGSLPII